MEMVRDFYHSDAVDHVVGDQVPRQNLFRRGGSGTELVGIGSVMAARRLVSAYLTSFTPGGVGGKDR